MRSSIISITVTILATLSFVNAEDLDLLNTLDQHLSQARSNVNPIINNIYINLEDPAHPAITIETKNAPNGTIIQNNIVGGRKQSKIKQTTDNHNNNNNNDINNENPFNKSDCEQTKRDPKSNLTCYTAVPKFYYVVELNECLLSHLVICDKNKRSSFKSEQECLEIAKPICKNNN